MLNDYVKVFCIIGFLFVCILGTLSHFFYFWSGRKRIVGIFFPVNESTWEHLKLSIFPTLFYFGFCAIFINNSNYVFAIFSTMIIPIILIPIIFYSCRFFVGKSILWIDISNFYFSVFLSWFSCYFILNQDYLGYLSTIISYIGIFIIILFYLSFTIYPPKIFLFKDPISGEYGIK